MGRKPHIYPWWKRGKDARVFLRATRNCRMIWPWGCWKRPVFKGFLPKESGYQQKEDGRYHWLQRMKMEWGAPGQRQGLPKGPEGVTLIQDSTKCNWRERIITGRLPHPEDANIILYLPLIRMVSLAPYISSQLLPLLTLQESQATWGLGRSWLETLILPWNVAKHIHTFQGLGHLCGSSGCYSAYHIC